MMYYKPCSNYYVVTLYIKLYAILFFNKGHLRETTNVGKGA